MLEKLRILVADDSSTIRRFVINALEHANSPTDIVEAANGTDCLHQLETGKFDIAFVDVNMPELSGLEAVAMSREGGLDTFVVIMSTEQSAERLQNARSLNVYEYLSKPFEQKDITSLLENYSRFKKPTSVLIVDDASTIRSVIKRVLKNSIFNLNVDEAADGPTALVAYQNNAHDVIFLDLNMPGMSGLDTLSMLPKLNENMKVVLITTENNKSIVQSVESSLIKGVLYKPFYPADVDRVLHDLFGLRTSDLDCQPQNKGNPVANEIQEKDLVFI